MTRWTREVSALVLRIAAGLIFLPHGYSKVFSSGGVAAFAADMPAYGIPSALGYVAAYGELIGGALLIVGLLTRVDAFLLAVTMFVAAFVVQLPDARQEIQPGSIAFLSIIRGIELPLAMFAMCVALVLTGGGRFSLDSLLRVEERLRGFVVNRKGSQVPST